MKKKPRFGKRLIGFVVLSLIVLSSYTGMIHGEETADITGVVKAVLSEDKMSSELTLKVSKNVVGAKVLKIELPNGEFVENTNTATFAARENKEYVFRVYYSVVNNDKDKPKVVEEKETIKYNVAGIETSQDTSSKDVKRTMAMPRGAENVNINEETFPDPSFRDSITSQSIGADLILTPTELASVKTLAVQGNNIQDLKGIEYFTSMTDFSATEASKLHTIDLSGNTKLTSIAIKKCHALKNLTIGEKPVLTSLGIEGEAGVTDRLLTGKLDTSGCPNLLYLRVTYTSIDELDLSNNLKLTNIDCFTNKIKKLDISKNTKLIELYASDNDLSSVDISNCPALTKIMVQRNTNLKELKIGNITKLQEIYISDTKIEKLDISKLTELTTYFSSGSSIRYIDNSNNPELVYLSTGSTNPIELPLDKSKKIDLREYLDDDFVSRINAVSINGGPDYGGAVVHPPILEGIDPTKELFVQTVLPRQVDGSTKAIRTYIKFQGTNGWITPLIMEGWSVGEQAKEPFAEPAFGDDTVKYQYSNAIDGTYTDTVPSTAGVWYVKASVAEKQSASAGMYTGLESEPVAFAINDWTSSLTVEDWNFGDTPKTPQITAVAGSENIKFEYANQKNGTYTDTLPTDAGTWYVRAVLVATNEYGGLTSDSVAFTINKNPNGWVTQPFIRNWTFGSEAAKPTAQAKLGNDTLKYQFSDKENGVYTDVVPDQIGTWYMKVTVDGTTNYDAIESITSFQIIKAQITGGMSVTYITGSANNAVFTCSGMLEDLTNVYVDGVLLNSKHYTLKSGSTILTLNHDYLDTLKPGKHVLRFEYGSETADIAFEVVRGKGGVSGPTSNRPNTGDHTKGALYVSLITLSVLVIGVVLERNRKDLKK